MEIEGINVDIRVRNNKRMRSLKIGTDKRHMQVYASVPSWVEMDYVETLLKENIDTLREMQEEIDKSKKEIDFSSMYLFGKKYDIEHRSGKTKIGEVNNNTIILYGDMMKSAERLGRSIFKKELPRMMDECVQVTGRAPKEFRIKRMKTKWGTCNVVHERIWINLVLVQMPEEIIKEVITHELTHLYVRNHGSEFKKLMDDFYPGWDKIEKANMEYKKYGGIIR